MTEKTKGLIQMARKTNTSTEVKSRWNAANYKTYRINLRYDTDQALIDFVDKYKADHDGIGITDMFRAGVEQFMQEQNKQGK